MPSCHNLSFMPYRLLSAALVSFAIASLSYLSPVFGAPAGDNGQSDDGSLSLTDAVKALNNRASNNPIGKEQPPLTEDEVIASLRAIERKRTPMPDDVYDSYQKIIVSRTLPPKAKLDFTTGWEGYNGYRFVVWWVDLSIKTSDTTGYTYRLRDRKISSRPFIKFTGQ